MALLSNYVVAQIIDKYGINIGASYSNQFWDYKSISIDNPNKDYKIGLSIFLSTKKKNSEMFNIRSELGYIQKGFKNNTELTFSDGTSAGINKKNVILHNLAANIGLKITLLDLKSSPYILLGLHSDYMISYKDIVLEEQGSGLKFNIFKYSIDEFNKLNLGGLIGIVFEFNNLTFMEIEYNPSITNSYNLTGLEVKDNCWGIKLGLNINKTDGKKNECTTICKSHSF